MRGRELLSKYIQSGLSNDERFELEKLALDDDFLADAWEGISSKDSKNAQEILSRLDERLATGTSKVKIVPIYKKLWPYAVAASVILVLSVGVLLRSNQDMSSDVMASVIIDEEQTETMADVSTKEESHEQEASTEADEQVIELESIVSKKTNQSPTKRSEAQQPTQAPTPPVIEKENAEPEGTLASVDLDIQDDVSSDIASIQTVATVIVPQPKQINTRSKTNGVEATDLANAKLDVKSSSASYNQPTTDKILNTNNEGLPTAKARRKIEQADMQIASAEAENKVSKAILKKEDDLGQIKEAVTVIELDQSFDLGAHIALQDSGDLIVLAEDDGFVAIQDNLDSGLSTPLLARDFLGANVSSFVPSINDTCAVAKASYRTYYISSPSPEGARDLYNFLREKGCPTDGSDVFMAELRLEYETWAAEQNAKKQSELTNDNPANLASQAYRDGNWEEAIKKYREAIANETDDTKKAKHHFSIASILFRKLKKYDEAREEALIATSLDPSFGRPYILIGDMYAVTARSCGDSWNQRLAILAAYDKYAKAKSIDPKSVDEASSKMEKYRSSFPMKDEGFMRQVKVRDEQRVGCWIDEIVKVRFRD